MGLEKQALEYTQQGWPVIPLHVVVDGRCSCENGLDCPRKGKHPRTERGLKDASIDERQVLNWWKRMPNANVGIRTGVDAGIFVIDVDVDEEKGVNGFKTLLDLEEKYGPLPATLCARTGRGGRHIIFRHPGGDVRIKNDAKTRLGEGLDVRGDGGYIVAPPSLHLSGRRYEWENEMEPAEAPEWLVDLVKKTESSGGDRPTPSSTVVDINDERARRFGQGALDSEVKELAGCATGGRNHKLNRAAFRIGQLSAVCGISEYEAYLRLMEAAEACGLIRDDGRDQAEKSFRSGWRSGLEKPRDLPPSNRPAPAPAPTRKAPPAPMVEEASAEEDDLAADYEERAAELADDFEPQAPSDEEEEDEVDAPEAGTGDGDGTGGARFRQEITITAGELDRVVTEAEVALLNSDIKVYQRGGILVRPIRETSMTVRGITRKAGALVVKEVEEAWLVEAFTRAAHFQKWDARKDGYRRVDCPAAIARTYLARAGEWRMPTLLGIIEAPTLRPDGTILERPGYDPATGLLFDPGRTRFESIPEEPTREDAIAALEKIKAVLVGFPFDQPHDLAIAIAAILTGLIRRSIPSAPMFAFNAPKMGSGKSLLADVVSLFATGRRASVMTPVANPEEEHKRLLAVLMEGDPVVVVDNISAAWASDAMCSVLTQEVFKGRLLGSTKTISAPTCVTWLATGNNLTFVGDLTTRVQRCDLDPQVERPEQRSFDVDLHEYIPEHRGELVPAALTILRAYVVAGRPPVDIAPYGRFEAWSAWVRSALVWLDVADPCLCIADLEASDSVRAQLVQVLSGWHGAVGDDRVSVQGMIGISRLSENASLQAALMDVASQAGEINSRRLGKFLSKYEKRIESGFRLEKAGMSHGNQLWKVSKLSGGLGDLGGSSSINMRKIAEDHANSHEGRQDSSPKAPNHPTLFDEGDA